MFTAIKNKLPTGLLPWAAFAVFTIGVIMSVLFVFSGLSAMSKSLDQSHRESEKLAEQVRKMGGDPVVEPTPEPPASGLDGLDGQDGIDGIDGQDGRDGRDGKDGRNGRDGRSGEAGAPGSSGTNGASGLDGKDGADGAPGAQGPAGPPGPQGEPGQPGQDGADGVDGTSPSGGGNCPDGQYVYGISVDGGTGAITPRCRPLPSNPGNGVTQ